MYITSKNAVKQAKAIEEQYLNDIVSSAMMMSGLKADIKQVNQAAKTLGMNAEQRRAFGDYIESLKKIVPNNKNFSWKELIEIGKEFIE